MSFCPRNGAGALEQVCFSTARTNRQEQQRGLTRITKHAALGSGGTRGLRQRSLEAAGFACGSLLPAGSSSAGCGSFWVSLTPASRLYRIYQQHLRLLSLLEEFRAERTGFTFPKGSLVAGDVGRAMQDKPWGSCCSCTRISNIYPCILQRPGGCSALTLQQDTKTPRTPVPCLIDLSDPSTTRALCPELVHF